MAERGEGVAVPDQRQRQNQKKSRTEPTTITTAIKNQDPAGQQQYLLLNWSNFKPEFSGKCDEDATAHLFHSNDCMNAQHFVDGVKIQRLWFQSLEPINVDWPELQNLFRQRYSEVGNTREQLFHAW